MNEKVVNRLIELGYHVSFAESCTGGLACGYLVDVANASKVLDVSFVTYANEAKMKYLGVKEESIQEYGVVSESVAGQMAQGVMRASGSQVGIGITGVAGPGGGTCAKPVGMVCFGIAINEQLYTYEKQFGNIGRNQVREESVSFVFRQLLELLG